jgi:SAM-dependent methyltransferase
MQTTTCYLCSADDYTVLFPGSDPSVQLSAEHIAARQGSINKTFSYNWVRCKNCGLVYANPIPDANSLVYLYAKSDQGNYAHENDNLVLTYGRYLDHYADHISKFGTALDVGAGNGFFLSKLTSCGFKTVIGIEPSARACASAPRGIRPLLRNTMFKENDFMPASVDFISCFQTLEHINRPDLLLESFSKVLVQEGLIYCVAHNFGTLGVRMLGARHPIVNAGHLTLFDKKTAWKMFAKYFDVIDVFPISNRYSLHYWLTLLPVSDRFKRLLIRVSQAASIDKIAVTMSLGNMGIIAKKI